MFVLSVKRLCMSGETDLLSLPVIFSGESSPIMAIRRSLIRNSLRNHFRTNLNLRRVVSTNRKKDADGLSILPQLQSVNLYPGLSGNGQLMGSVVEMLPDHINEDSLATGDMVTRYLLN